MLMKKAVSVFTLFIILFAALTPALPARAAGTATVRVELRAIGCGDPVPPTAIETDGTLRASEAVLRVLAENGYTAFYGGSPADSFYLAYIADGNKTGSFNGYRCAGEAYPVKNPKRLGVTPRIPEKVSAYLTAHADYFDPADYETNFSGYLGEFVFTNGSGWMYTLNGAYLQKDLSSVLLQPGDTLTLKYTLWYGADVGGAQPAVQAAFDAAMAHAETTSAAPAPETTEQAATAQSTTAPDTTAAPVTTEPPAARTTAAPDTAEERTTAESTTEVSTTAQSTTEESTTEQSTTEESTTEESTTAESPSGTEASEEPAAETDDTNETNTAKTYLYWVIPAAAAVPVTALAVVIFKKHKQKETENT